MRILLFITETVCGSEMSKGNFLIKIPIGVKITRWVESNTSKKSPQRATSFGFPKT